MVHRQGGYLDELKERISGKMGGGGGGGGEQ